MKILFRVFFALFAISLASSAFSKQESFKALSKRVFDLAQKQYIAMSESVKDSGRFPKSIKDGKLETSDRGWWCSGFFPGSLWYIYEYGKDESVKNLALLFTKKLEPLSFANTPIDHDIGFQINCSYGNAYRLTKDKTLLPIMLASAEKLSKRFSPEVGAIKSWNWKSGYPVIIDNMMNLELLCEASKISSNKAYLDVAKAHADTTMKNHFRPDGSSFHLVLYDENSGAVLRRQTWQGLSDASAWARGQAWGLYGYVMMYRETEICAYLRQAEKIAKFILEHKNLPADKVPLWDFDAPKDALRDASAAAIIASALIDLSQLTKDRKLSKLCLQTAETQLRTLASDAYLAKPGTNCNFILKHSVGSLPHKSEVDVPLSYADYYFLEALLKFSRLGIY